MKTIVDMRNTEATLNEPALDALTLRLDRLERQNRRWRAVALVGVVLLVAWGGATNAGSRAVQEEVRTRGLTVVDKLGRTVVSIDGWGNIWIQEPAFDNEPALTRIRLGMWTRGEPVLLMNDPAGVARVILGNPNPDAPSSTTASLVMARRDGKVIWKAP